jgi:nicotinamidase-related amidase
MTHIRILERNQSALLVIDVQEAYRGVTVEQERMLRGVRRLIEAAKILGVPILATEQYPKGLGHLMREVAELFPAGFQPIEKISLSCCGEPRFAARLSEIQRRQIVVCGLETHACINQTTHDLLEQGYQVHLPFDAISSRFETDYRIGWDKLIGSGAIPTTVEMACLEWVKTAAAPEFKAIQKLIK